MRADTDFPTPVLPMKARFKFVASPVGSLLRSSRFAEQLDVVAKKTHAA